MRAKVRDQAPQWRDSKVIQDRYLRLCTRLHISSELFVLKFDDTQSRLSMSFRKDAYKVAQKYAMFGKNIIITDNIDWTTSDIVKASLDRWQVENRFRLCNDNELVGARPLRHWSDSKIRCHLFTCVVAMTYLRRIELKLSASGIQRTAESVMEDMRDLHSVLKIDTRRRKPVRQLEAPSKTQAEVLTAFGHRIDDGGVLQVIPA